MTGSTGTGRSSNETVRLNDQNRSYAWDDEVVVVRYNYKGDLSVSSISSVKNDDDDGYLAVLDSNVLIGLIIREVDTTTGGGGSGRRYPDCERHRPDRQGREHL